MCVCVFKGEQARSGDFIASNGGKSFYATLRRTYCMLRNNNNNIVK